MAVMFTLHLENNGRDLVLRRGREVDGTERCRLRLSSATLDRFDAEDVATDLAQGLIWAMRDMARDLGVKD